MREERTDPHHHPHLRNCPVSSQFCRRLQISRHENTNLLRGEGERERESGREEQQTEQERGSS